MASTFLDESRQAPTSKLMQRNRENRRLLRRTLQVLVTLLAVRRRRRSLGVPPAPIGKTPIPQILRPQILQLQVAMLSLLRLQRTRPAALGIVGLTEIQSKPTKTSKLLCRAMRCLTRRALL